MKIGSTHDTTAVDTQLRSTRTAGASTTAPLSATPATDRVDVSAAASELGAAGAGDFDQAKVEAIRTAIAEGRFTVNAGKIADGLIADAAALLAPRSA